MDETVAYNKMLLNAIEKTASYLTRARIQVDAISPFWVDGDCHPAVFDGRSGKHDRSRANIVGNIFLGFMIRFPYCFDYLCQVLACVSVEDIWRKTPHNNVAGK